MCCYEKKYLICAQDRIDMLIVVRISSLGLVKEMTRRMTAASCTGFAVAGQSDIACNSCFPTQTCRLFGLEIRDHVKRYRPLARKGRAAIVSLAVRASFLRVFIVLQPSSASASEYLSIFRDMQNLTDEYFLPWRTLCSVFWLVL
jgi:hypothetical protein